MGQLEAAVMDALWDGDGDGLTPGEVQDVLAEHHEVAYTTVMTILVRLWQKERVDRERNGRAFAYRPLLTREEFAADRMRAALGEGGDRSNALAAFVDSLDTRERAQLRRMLQRPAPRRG
jgi:predicted transcriptional regulator